MLQELFDIAENMGKCSNMNVIGPYYSEMSSLLEKIQDVDQKIQEEEEDIEILSNTMYSSSCDPFWLPNGDKNYKINHADEAAQSCIMTNYKGPVCVEGEVNDGMLFMEIKKCKFRGNVSDLEYVFKYYTKCLNRDFKTFSPKEGIIHCLISGVPRKFIYSCGHFIELKEGVEFSYLPYPEAINIKYSNGKFSLPPWALIPSTAFSNS